jgi:hypothetical protein
MTKNLTVTKEPPKTENPHNDIPVESPVIENQIREPQLEPNLTEDLNNGAAADPQVRAQGKNGSGTRIIGAGPTKGCGIISGSRPSAPPLFRVDEILPSG